MSTLRRPVPVRVHQPQPTHAIEPMALRGGPRPRLSPYKRQALGKAQRFNPSIAPLHKFQPLQPLGTSAHANGEAIARMAAACQHDHAAAWAAPVSIKDLLHRKPQRPAVLPQLSASAPSAALLSRRGGGDPLLPVASRQRKPSTAPLCRRPTAARRAKKPPAASEAKAAAARREAGACEPISCDLACEPISCEPSPPPAAPAVEAIARPAPIELPAGDELMMGCTPPTALAGPSSADCECLRDFSPPVLRGPPIMAVAAASPPPPLPTAPLDFSPPVLRPPSRLLAPSPAPGASSPSTGGRTRVSLVYDQVLNCYFDPVTHRYFELC